MHEECTLNERVYALWNFAPNISPSSPSIRKINSKKAIVVDDNAELMWIHCDMRNEGISLCAYSKYLLFLHRNPLLAFSIQTQIFACGMSQGEGMEYIKRLFFIHRFSHALDLGTIEK